MKNLMKKKWSKPEIRLELKIKETLAQGGPGADGSGDINKLRT